MPRCKRSGRTLSEEETHRSCRETQTVVNYPNASVPNDGAGGCNELGRVTRTLNTSAHLYDWIYKMDINIGKSDQLSGRYIFQKSNF